MPRTGMTGQLPFIELRDSKVEGSIAVLTLEATDSSEHIIRVDRGCAATIVTALIAVAGGLETQPLNLEKATPLVAAGGERAIRLQFPNGVALDLLLSPKTLSSLKRAIDTLEAISPEKTH